MTESTIKQFLEKISRAKHKYCGTIDENGFRCEKGYEYWVDQFISNKYYGQFLYNNLHTKGIYLIEKGDHVYFDGNFYANKLEGYGKVIYSDGTYFQGLFKQHQRFGPGVFTYTDSTQDVGIWDGFSLIKICVLVGKDVPCLAQTSMGKARLLKYRNLVPLHCNTTDVAKDLMDEIEANEEVKNQVNKLYNKHVRNKNSLFFWDSSYYEKFFDELDCTIEVTISREEFEELRSLEEYADEKESVSSTKSKCVCFRASSDRFVQLCIQLHEMEVKLEKAIMRKNQLQEKMQNCEICCKRSEFDLKKTNKQEVILPLGKSNTEKLSDIKAIIKNQIDSSFFDEHNTVTTDENNVSSSDEHRMNLLKLSETELKNYLYTSSHLMNKDFSYSEFNSEEQSNKGHSNHSVDMLGQINSFFEISAENIISINEASYIGRASSGSSNIKIKGCCCNEKRIENYDILESKLKVASKQELFYSTIRYVLKTQLDMEFQKINDTVEEEERYVKRVRVSSLLAWNNEKLWTAVLQHCFRHRSSENNVTFNVLHVLTGHRHYFSKPGSYELNCRKFIEACYEGFDRNAFHFLRSYNINPNVCDARGNTGMMLAAIANKNQVIAMLAKFGGNVDVMNDEGLTPLTMSLLQYISFKYRISDWEQAFLQQPKENFDNSQQWRPMESIVSINLAVDFEDVEEEGRGGGGEEEEEKNVPLSQVMNNTWAQFPANEQLIEMKEKLGAALDFNSKTLQMQLSASSLMPVYFFNTEFVKVVVKKETEDKKSKKSGRKKEKQKQRKKKKKEKPKRKQKKKSEKGTKQTKNSTQENEDKQKKEENSVLLRHLNAIKKTIMTLLSCGSDPNFGEVPMKPIFLAIFTDDSNLVGLLLENKADPNVTITNENLSCLHVIGSLKPTEEKVKMCNLLLDHGAEPNLKTNSNHWEYIRQEIIGEGGSVNDSVNEGKNVLHLICLREDYENDTSNYLGEMVHILITRGCRSNDLYLGHTPLSLAALRGNVKLVEVLLKTGLVDPHYVLGYGMGNALTVLVLQRFSSLLSESSGKEVVKCLLTNGLNPLNKVGDFENSISVLKYEENLIHLKQKDSKISKKKGQKLPKLAIKSKKEKKKKATKRSKNKAKKKSKQPNSQEIVKNYIKEEARKILFRHSQSKAIEYLYTLISEGLFADPLIVILAKYVNPDEVLKYIELLFQHGIIDGDRFNEVVVSDLLEFVKLQYNFGKLSDLKESEEAQAKIKSICWTQIKIDPKKIYNPLPEVDRDEEKYRVCFQCLLSTGKKLFRCPSCELVYFCSEECNALNVKTCPYHVCKLLFYDSVSQIIGEEVQPSKLGTLLQLANKLHLQRTGFLKLKVLEQKVSSLRFITSATKEKTKLLASELKKLKNDTQNFIRDNSLSDLWAINETWKEVLANIKLKNQLDLAVTDSESNVLSLAIDEFLNPAKNTVSSKDTTKINSKSMNAVKSSEKSLKKPSTMQSSKPMSLPKTINAPTDVLLAFDKARLLPPRFGPVQEVNQGTPNMPNSEYYMQLLSNIFADFNLPLLLLPYACYKDGQLYYSMAANGKAFQKLQIPK